MTALSSTYSANSAWRDGVVFFHTQDEKDGRETRVTPEAQGLDVAETNIAKRLPAINTSSENCVLSRVGHTVLHFVTGIHSRSYPARIKKGNSISEYTSVQPAV